jgi:hypothetical protein
MSITVDLAVAVLTTAATHSPELLPNDDDALRVKAETWAAALYGATLDQYRDAIRRHYARTIRPIGCADLNAYTDRRDSTGAAAHLASIPRGAPPPADAAAQLHAVRHPAHALALTVHCSWCLSPAGSHCRVRTGPRNHALTRPHPTRLQLAQDTAARMVGG